MVEFKFLRYLYPMYLDLHYSFPNHPSLQWLLAIAVFIQYSFLTLHVSRPSSYFDANNDKSIFQYILNVLYFLPWIWGIDPFFLDSLFWLLGSIVSTLLIVYIANKSYKGEYVPFLLIIWGRLFSQYFIQLFSFPLFFRISLLIEYIIYDHGLIYLGTLTIYLLVLFIFLCHQYVASVFLVPFCFLCRSRLDVYDGKTHMFVYCIQMIFSISFQLFSIWKSYAFSGIAFAPYIILLLFLLYFRLFTTVHVSLVAQFMELAPLFSLPFMVLAHLYGPSKWFYFVLILFFLNVGFVMIINLVRRLMKHVSFQILGSFIYNDNSSPKLPKFVPGNICSVIRIISHHNSDPNVLSRFMENQKQTHLRTSVFLELCRYIVIFPERRQEMLHETYNFSSNSTYNRYTLFLFKKAIRSLSTTQTTKKHLNHLNEIYSSYIVHFYLYWNSRKNHEYFHSFLEAFKVTHFFMECRAELRKLLHRFPCCSHLHKLYSELLLNLDGDFEGYKKQKAISKCLEERSDSISDPLLHPMAMINPKILQYCNSSGKLSLSSSSTTGLCLAKNDTLTSFFSRPHKKESRKKTSIASKIQKSRRGIPYFHYFNYLLPVLIAGLFIFHAYPYDYQALVKEKFIASYTLEMTKTLYTAVAAIFIPYAIKDIKPGNIINVTSCREEFMLIPILVSDFFVESPLISYLNEVMMVLTYQEISILLEDASNVCFILDQLPSNMEKLAVTHLNNIVEQKMNCSRSLYDFYDHYSSEYNISVFVFWGTVIMAAFLVIYFITACISLNQIMKNNVKAIEFFSSKERFQTVLQEIEVREKVWEQLKDFASSSINVSDSISQLHLESDTDQNEQKSSSQQQQMNSNTAYSVDSDFSESDEKLRLVRTSSKLSIASSFTGSGLNILKQPKAFVTDPSKLMDISDQTDTETKSTPRQEVDQEVIDNLIGSKNQQDKFSHFYPLLMGLTPWLMLYIFFFFSYFPIHRRCKAEQDKISDIYYIDKHMGYALRLLNSSFYLLYDGYKDLSIYLATENDFRKEQSPISELYYVENCYEFRETICISISSIVHQIVDGDISELYIIRLVIPAIVAFAENAMTSVFTTTLTSMPVVRHSNGICFLIMAVLTLFLILYMGYIHSVLVKKGLNSLFHFPDIFAKKKEKKEIDKKIKKVQRFPTNIILVTSVTESDEIYSISDSILSIINKSSSEMICKRFSKTFPVIDEKAGFQIRENSGKTFISRSKKIGMLTKTILIETTKIEMKSKGFNVIQKLANFIPAYFAKPFSEELTKNYHFDKSVLIFIRMNPKAGQLDKFFTCVDMQIQMYFNIELIRTNGSVLTCICKEVNELEVFLFLRDIIKESENSCRGQKANFALKSIYVDQINELNFEIVKGSEPSAKFEEQQFETMEITSYEIDDKCIGGSEETVLYSNKIIDYTSEKETINGKKIRFISFDKFINEFVCKI
ncbi:hypothetical protein TRFO_12436 [Tritrichomonas foetus]|uniref:Uncharacterized protein n=1 Tax=Tritrichomonas foetus TaxID=1144522 RepID=A0A1J4L5S4_9EUKA|nr:hypothetical protein TRFO_12436 [Tritrichomonas foetus]|eukprot:OHT17302.1 hypothetical protein TRFO_12436 [Tritrichomonas foetus]